MIEMLFFISPSLAETNIRHICECECDVGSGIVVFYTSENYVTF